MSAKILIVDDEDEVVKIVATHLRKAGYKTLTANNGADAIRLAKESTPDLILLDVILPEVEGFTVCETLRRWPATAKTPILMLTALFGELPRSHGYECGATDYIGKPFKHRELIARVRQALANRETRSAEEADD